MDYIYPVMAFDNYDGDSFNLSVDLGFDLIIHKQCRLFGVDTPELRTSDPVHKAAGYLAKDQVRAWCEQAMAEGGLYFASENYEGKFGRPLGDLVRELHGTRQSLREYLLEHHYGVAYHGQAKREVADAHRLNFETLQQLGELVVPEAG